MPGWLGQRIRRRPVVSFLLLAFLWTWGYDLLVSLFVGSSPGILVRGVVRAWGPLIAAGVVTWAIGGELREWAGQVTKWRVGPQWYAIALVFPFLLKGSLLASGVHLLNGGAVAVLPSPWWHYVANAVVVFFVAGGLEEFGWRGFAQPRLQERRSALAAAVGIGVAWTLWHLPLFYLFDLGAYDPGTFWTSYLFTNVVMSVALAWVYNGTGGSLLFPMLVHSLGNLPALVAPTGELGLLARYSREAFIVVFLVGVVVAYGPKYLAPSKPVPLVPGNVRGGETRAD